MLNLSVKIKDVVKIIRYPNLLIMVATQLLSALWLTSYPTTVWSNSSLWFTIIATVFVAAAGYIINDIFDFDADSINKPHKVFISHENKSQYGLLYYGLSVLGILFGLAASVYVGLVCLLMVGLLYWYSYKLKKTVFWGNFSIALMSAAVLLVLLFIFPTIEKTALCVYAAFAFFTTLVREVAKDIEDVEGDRKANYLTLPVVKGEKFAQKIAVFEGVLLLACTIAFSVWCLTNLKLWAFFYLVILVVIPTVGLVLLLYWAKEKKHFSQVSLLSKLIMLSGIISMYFIV